MLFGAFRLLTQVPFGNLVILLAWLIGVVLVHDGVLSPPVVAVGWVVARLVPPRARRYLQVAMIVGAPITLIAIPLILRRGSQPPSKALLLRNYGMNLTVLLAIVATLSLAAYAVRVASDLRRDQPSPHR
jgi:cobalamin biosynthesis protein CobD/CbiB